MAKKTMTPKTEIPKWTFSPRQMLAMFWWDNPAFSHCSGIIADGAVRSGKTVSLSFGFLMWSMRTFDNRQFGMCGKTIKSFERNVLSQMKLMCQGLGYVLQEKKADNLVIITDKKTGHVNNYYLFGGNDERSQDLIQGITLAGLLLDEVVLMPESFVNQALARCSVTGSKVWMNCNPEGSQHYVKRRFIDQYNRLKYLYVHFTMDDNLTLSDERRNFYKRQWNGLFYRRYILGEWCLASGLVFSAFNQETMVYEEDDEEDCYTASFCSGDYGTTNPTAFLYISYNYKRDCFDVRDEYYYNSRETEVQKTDTQYVDDIGEFVAGREVQRAFLDPAAASLMVALRQAHTFPRLEQANNDVLSGIKWTNMLFSMGKIRINARCRNLIRELGVYAWDDEKSEKTGVDTVLKVCDHACDALRYFAYTETYGRRRLYGLQNMASVVNE